MEWGKAKSTLIILLALLNAVLLTANLGRVLDKRSVTEVYQGTMEILESRGIVVECEMPKERDKSAHLIYELNNSYRMSDPLPGERSNVGHAAVALPDAKRWDAEIRRMTAGSNIDLSTFVLDRIELSNGGAVSGSSGAAGDDGGDVVVRYLLSYQGELIFDSGIDFIVAPDGSIAQVVGNYRSVKGFSDNKPTEVLPAHLVLLKNYPDAGSVIARIDLGFMSQSASDDSVYRESEEGAVWRIRQADGTTRFFEALYGDEIVA